MSNFVILIFYLLKHFFNLSHQSNTLKTFTNFTSKFTLNHLQVSSKKQHTIYSQIYPLLLLKSSPSSEHTLKDWTVMDFTENLRWLYRFCSSIKTTNYKQTISWIFQSVFMVNTTHILETLKLAKAKKLNKIKRMA